MSVTATVHYSCNGCDAVEEIQVGPLRSRFRGAFGGDSGFGNWVDEEVDIKELCPEGWMAFDPYTRCCYCPVCIEKIWPEPEERHGLGFKTVVSGVP